MMKKIAIVACLLTVLTGCGPRLIYPHLEWLVPWYVSDYISLDKTQKNMLQQRLLKQLDWHCRTQLPAYAVLLRGIGGDFSDPNRPVDYAKIQSYNIKAMALWKELMQQIGPDISEILETASDEQIQELFDNLAKQNQEFQKKYVDQPSEQLIENRQKRMVKRLKFWISDLTTEQKTVVSDWSSTLTPISQGWLQNREFVQAQARRLLSERNNSPDFHAALLEFIVNPEKMRLPAYQAKIDTNIDVSIIFVIRLNQMLTQRQRTYFLNRLESLSSDFDKLSCDPRDVPRPDKPELTIDN